MFLKYLPIYVPSSVTWFYTLMFWYYFYPMEGERKRGEKQKVFKNKHSTFVSQFQKLRMKSTNSHRWDTEGAKKKKKKS